MGHCKMFVGGCKGNDYLHSHGHVFTHFGVSACVVHSGDRQFSRRTLMGSVIWIRHLFKHGISPVSFLFILDYYCCFSPSMDGPCRIRVVDVFWPPFGVGGRVVQGM